MPKKNSVAKSKNREDSIRRSNSLGNPSSVQKQLSSERSSTRTQKVDCRRISIAYVNSCKKVAKSFEGSSTLTFSSRKSRLFFVLLFFVTLLPTTCFHLFLKITFPGVSQLQMTLELRQGRTTLNQTTRETRMLQKSEHNHEFGDNELASNDGEEISEAQ